MKALLWFLAAFALAVALSLAMRGSNGYALFVLPPWRVEISLNLFIILVFLGFAAGYLLVRLLSQTMGLPAYVRAFRERRREEKGRVTSMRAIQALFEGRFVRAEKLASEAHDLGVAPGFTSLVAARAAQRLRDFARRDRWLEQAKGDDGNWRLARLMTTAELLLEERRFDEARAVLRELHADGPRQVATLLLLLRAEQGLANWEEVVRIARLLEKRDAMPPEALEGICLNARIALLGRKMHHPGGLGQYWDEIPQAERLHPKLAAAAARAFMQAGDCRTAHRIIEKALEQDWDGSLALLYSECADDDALERIERAEGWLHERPGEAELLLTLGRLCMQRELWGKAQSYLEASLSTHPTPATHAALANLFDRIGRTEDANRHFRASAGVRGTSS